METVKPADLIRSYIINQLFYYMSFFPEFPEIRTCEYGFRDPTCQVGRSFL